MFRIGSPADNRAIDRLAAHRGHLKLPHRTKHRQELAEKGRRQFDDLAQVAAADACRAAASDHMDEGIRVRGIEARYPLSLGQPVSKFSHTLFSRGDERIGGWRAV